MKKLKLRLEDLRIDSFDTAEARRAAGTVFGQETAREESCAVTCYGQESCYDTCPASCYGSCDETCAGWASFPHLGAECILC